MHSLNIYIHILLMEEKLPHREQNISRIDNPVFYSYKPKSIPINYFYKYQQLINKYIVLTYSLPQKTREEELILKSIKEDYLEFYRFTFTMSCVFKIGFLCQVLKSLSLNALPITAKVGVFALAWAITPLSRIQNFL